MASSRIGNASPSEFRLVLTKLTEVQKKLDTTDQSSVMAQLRQVNDSLQIVEGNQTDISDAILNKLQSIETRIETGFKALEEKIAALERKVVDGPAIAEGSAFGMLTPPSSSKKRKIARHPDLSHYVRSKIEQLGLAWNTDKKENEPPNLAVVATIVKEVKEVEQIQNDSLCTERRILDAISQNFASSKKRRRQEEYGTYEHYQREQKKRKRIKRKLDKRLKVASEEEKRQPIFEALHPSLVSSDESDEEDPTSMVTRPLTWRTEEVTNFFHILDQRYKSSMTNQQKRQSVNRRVGRPSHRNSREIPEKLLWATT